MAVVNEAFVRAVSPDAPLMGRQVRLLGVTETPLEVVGVVSDARPFRLGGQERPRAVLSVLAICLDARDRHGAHGARAARRR